MIHAFKIEQVVRETLSKVGVPNEDIKIIADSILHANLKGKHPHGIGRLPIYVRKIKEGLMDPLTTLTIIKDNKAVAVIDANHGFGQVAGVRGMEICLNKAKEYGVGVVGVRNSNNFGVAGFIGELAVENDMIGIVLASSAPAIAPPGGKKPIFGTNPLCIAIPGNKDNPPIVLDMASTNVSRGKIRLAAQKGEPIPFGWAVDEDGKPTDCPLKALEGSLIPIGGYKGFGIAMAIDILAGLITGSAFAGQARPLNHPSEYSAHGHFLMAINTEFFFESDAYKERLRELWQNIKSCGDKESIFLPGERSYYSKQEAGNMADLPEPQIKEINQLLGDLGIDITL